MNKGGGGLFEPGGGGLFGGNSCCCFCLSVWGNSCWCEVLFHLAGGGCGPGPCLPIFCFFKRILHRAPAFALVSCFLSRPAVAPGGARVCT